MSSLIDQDATKLREIAERGFLSRQQPEEALHTAWRVQQGECPFCREAIPWHRGIMFQNGHKVAWICMLCALLDVCARKKPDVAEIGANAIEGTVPLPPGFRLAWINANRIPWDDLEPLPTAAQIARMIGRELDFRVWAAAIEDDGAVRLVPPRDANDPNSPWRPFLIKGNPSLVRRSSLLAKYIDSDEEIITTDLLHEAIGLDVVKLPAVRFELEGEEPLDYPRLEEGTLREIPSMNGIQRRACVPRMGLVLKDVWEMVKAENPSGIHKHAFSCSFDQSYLVYLIPFSSCGTFYYPGDTPPWGINPDVFMPRVGFNIDCKSDENYVNGDGLWECVLASALTPD